MSSTSPVLKSRAWKPRASDTIAPSPSLRSAIEPIFIGTSQERISRPSWVARNTRPSKLSIQ